MEDKIVDNDVDVLIVGAGLSGVGMAAKLTMHCPDVDFLMLEQREDVGGTWDLFRYPGVRSDSDMHTLGYGFKPWTRDEAIADGESIKNYIAETASDFGFSDKIRFGQRVTSACWVSDEKCWHVFTMQSGGERECLFRANFLVMCSGYYDYDAGHKPHLPGSELFSGPIIHPQHWPKDFDPKAKTIVVVGSGATAVTLAPSLAVHAKQVIMLQRSPSYIASRPRVDRFANRLRSLLNDRIAYAFIRWRNIKVQRLVYWVARHFPAWLARRFQRLAREEMPNLAEFQKHMQPQYEPCEQRLCLIPDGDLFRSVRDGKVRIVTDTIDHFTADGIALRSGEHLESDAVVTATGLNLALFGKATFHVDGRTVNFPDHVYYKGAMLNDIPNLVSMFGYVNISWTLRSEFIATYVCRLLNVMAEKKAKTVVAELGLDEMERSFVIDSKIFSPGYYLRSQHIFPKNADRHPWRILQSYTAEQKIFNRDPIDDGILKFD